MTPLFESVEPILHGKPNTTASARFSPMPFRDPSTAKFDPPCAICMFALPFRLLLKDGAWLRARLCGQPIAIRVKERKQDSFDRRTTLAKLDGMELVDDRHGVVSYSEIEVQFPYALLLAPEVQETLGLTRHVDPQIIEIQWLETLNDAVESVALFVVNRLLKTYRILTAQHFIRPITRRELFYVQRGWLIPDLESPFDVAFGAPGHAIRLETHELSSEFHNILGEWLQSERPVPVWLELLQDANEYLQVGQFRHAVIDGRTALEVYLDQTLLLRQHERGKSARETAVELGIPMRIAAGVDSIEGALSLVRINDKLKRGLRSALGLQLGRRVIWAKWLRAKHVREHGVHYGVSILEDDAKHSVETVEQLVSIIHEAGSPASAFLKSLMHRDPP